MENEYNYGGQPDNGYDPNAGVNLNKNEGYDQNAGYDANANGGYNAYGAADNNGYDSFGNPISNMNDYGAPQNQGSSVLAIVSLVCGIVSVLGCCCYGLSALPGAAALITGIISMKKQNPGKGMAIAGVITGAIGVLSGIVMIVLVMLGMAGSMADYMDY